MTRLLIILFLAAHNGVYSKAPDRAPAQERHVVEVRWREIGGTPPVLDSELSYPVRIAASRSRFAVFDYGSQSVKMFSITGELLWSFGRGGQGPNEFRQVTRLRPGPGGTLWVTDMANARVTILTPDGRPERSVSLPEGCATALPFGDDILCVSYLPGSFARIVRSDGRVEGFPDPPLLEGLSPLVLEGDAVWVQAANVRAVAGFYHSGFLVSVGPEMVQVARGVEAIPFAEVLQWRNQFGETITRVSPEAAEGMKSIGQVGSVVRVLFGGSSAAKGRIIDEYHAETLQYRRSFVLPFDDVLDVAWLDERLVAVLLLEPVPHVVVLAVNGL